MEDLQTIVKAEHIEWRLAQLIKKGWTSKNVEGDLKDFLDRTVRVISGLLNIIGEMKVQASYCSYISPLYVEVVNVSNEDESYIKVSMAQLGIPGSFITTSDEWNQFTLTCNHAPA